MNGRSAENDRPDCTCSPARIDGYLIHRQDCARSGWRTPPSPRPTASSALSDALAAIATHNETPITSENLRYAATHEALCRSWIFDVLTGLADALDTRVTPSGVDQ